MKSQEYLKTATPEGFMEKCMKSTQGGKIIATRNKLGLMLARDDHFNKEGSAFAISDEFADLVEEYRQLILSEFNNVLENEK